VDISYHEVDVTSLIGIWKGTKDKDNFYYVIRC
jgi:hypothetical protein